MNVSKLSVNQLLHALTPAPPTTTFPFWTLQTNYFAWPPFDPAALLAMRPHSTARYFVLSRRPEASTVRSDWGSMLAKRP